MSQLQLLVAAFALGCLLYVHSAVNRYRTRKANEAKARQLGCLPPPVIPNHRPLGIDRIEQLYWASKEYRLLAELGTHHMRTSFTHQVNYFGKPIINTSEPANVEAILSTKFKDYHMGRRTDIVIDFFGDGIFTQDGAPWKHSRELLRPQFSYKQYENLEIFKETVDDLIDVLPKDGRVVDLFPFFNRLTLDTTTAFLFGESAQSLKAPESTGEQVFADAYKIGLDIVAQRFRIPFGYKLLRRKELQDACNVVHGFADRIIERNLSRDREADAKSFKYVFLDNMAESIPDRRALRDQIINILIAGRDTTACLLTWTFFHLVRHPHVFAKLRAEITSYPKDSDSITRTDLNKMTYLQNVLKEALRLYPSVPSNERSALQDTILPVGGGPDGKSPIFVPKDTTVSFFVWAMHRRADLYGLDAELFLPERWSDPELPLFKNRTLQNWGYLPFNGGPRICLGMDFALTEAAYAVFRLLRAFPSIELPENEKVDLVGSEKQTLTIVVFPTAGCKVKMSRDGSNE